jgi:hypothetical protein
MNNRIQSIIVATIFTLWALAALVAIASDLFYVPLGTPSRLLAVQLVGISILFVALVRISSSIRHTILRLDPVFLTSLQSWRILGMMFLFLAVLGELPWLFAIPAGIGDVLVGLAAPIVAARLGQGTLSRRAFAWFTGLGLLDFAVAFSFGNWVNLHPSAFGSYAAMSAWPLVLVPGFLVPTFAVLHLAAWFSFARRVPAGEIAAPVLAAK